NEYNTETLKNIPKERLLIYDIKTGWKPLCDFLNVPIPATEFPRVNSTNEFISNVKRS
ncbi:MAG: sulfotransferase, partial [Chitinophagales bacterium]